MERTPIGELIHHYEKTISAGMHSESTKLIIRGIIAQLELQLPAEREALEQAYNDGTDEGIRQAHSDNAICTHDGKIYFTTKYGTQ